MTRGARQRLRRERARVWTPQQRAVAADLAARGLTVAAFPQGCALCPRRIDVGSVVGRAPDGWAHADCLPDPMKQLSSKGRRHARRTAARKGTTTQG